MNTNMHLRLHRTKKALHALLEKLPPELRNDPAVHELQEIWAERPLAIVQLINRRRAYQNSSSDYEFSRRTMLDHWEEGADAVCKSLKKNDWRKIIMSRDDAASLDSEHPAKN